MTKKQALTQLEKHYKASKELIELGFVFNQDYDGVLELTCNELTLRVSVEGDFWCWLDEEDTIIAGNDEPDNLITEVKSIMNYPPQKHTYQVAMEPFTVETYDEQSAFDAFIEELPDCVNVQLSDCVDDVL